MLSLASAKKVVVEEEEAGNTRDGIVRVNIEAYERMYAIWNTFLIDEEALWPTRSRSLSTTLSSTFLFLFFFF